MQSSFLFRVSQSVVSRREGHTKSDEATGMEIERKQQRETDKGEQVGRARDGA